jgi:hypothetical protein
MESRMTVRPIFMLMNVATIRASEETIIMVLVRSSTPDM